MDEAVDMEVMVGRGVIGSNRRRRGGGLDLGVDDLGESVGWEGHQSIAGFGL
jgi:hypothetical protein